MKKKKYTAYLIGNEPNPLSWKKVDTTIQVDSLEEAEEWCRSNYPYLNFKVKHLIDNNNSIRRVES